MATRTTHPLFLRRLGEPALEGGRPAVRRRQPLCLADQDRGPGAAREPRSGGSDREDHELQQRATADKGRNRSAAAARNASTAGSPSSRPASPRSIPAIATRSISSLASATDQDDRTMAHDWTRTARELATMAPGDIAARFGAELADVAAGYPDRPASQVMSDAFQMYRRHGMAVDRVARAALGEMADHILNGTVPAGSLLAAILQSGVRAGAGADRRMVGRRGRTASGLGAPDLPAPPRLRRRCRPLSTHQGAGRVPRCPPRLWSGG